MPRPTAPAANTRPPFAPPMSRFQSVRQAADAHVIDRPDPNRPVAFQASLGTAYNVWSRLD